MRGRTTSPEIVELPTILHLDADAFFVSCELAKDPSLRGKACAVGGTERGIISSASYEARARGVYTPMPTRKALQVCPDLILLKHTRGLYGEVSRRMFELCERVTPVVQRNSIDEGYLDLSPCGFKAEPEIEAAARALQAGIWEQLQIPVSLGIARNKMVAQIASKLRKPRGFVVVPSGKEAAFLAPLSVGRLPGVGVKTEAALAAQGIRFVQDLFSRTESELAAILGEGWREMLARARGEDDRVVETDEQAAKSYSEQETFARDVGDPAEVERVAKGMVDSLMPKVRSDGARVRTITVKIRYPDFTHESHAHTLDSATDIEAPFYPLVGPLLRAAWRKRRPLRLVSVKLSGVDPGPAQLEMFAQADEKRRRLAGVLDRLNRGGADSVVTRGHQLGRPT